MLFKEGKYGNRNYRYFFLVICPLVIMTLLLHMHFIKTIIKPFGKIFISNSKEVKPMNLI